jgi:hypothetical protein
VLITALRLVVVAIVFAGTSIWAQDDRLPPEVRAVQQYLLEREYPELFGSQAYRTKVENALVTDLDQDGTPEVVLLVTPHYRQSAPIVIFRVSKDFTVTRVKEGLAPGPLAPLSGVYLDSHALGKGADFSFEASDRPLDRTKLLNTILRQRGGVVEYRAFFHIDSRTGDLAYIDMRHVTVPPGHTNCAGFEFSHVNAIAAGALETEPARVYLAAQVGSEVWLYHISEFLPNGLLQKEVRMERLPADFARFAPGVHPLLRYETPSGEMRPLRFGS